MSQKGTYPRTESWVLRTLYELTDCHISHTTIDIKKFSSSVKSYQSLRNVKIVEGK